MKIEIVKGEDNPVSDFFSSSDTPETDAFFFRIDIDWDMEVEFARKLERERDEAREKLADWEDSVKHVRAEYEDEQHCSCVPILRKLLKDAERERDDARNMVEKLTEQGLAMMDENRSLKREIKKLKKKYE
jgi:hypothetical protein